MCLNTQNFHARQGKLACSMARGCDLGHGKVSGKGVGLFNYLCLDTACFLNRLPNCVLLVLVCRTMNVFNEEVKE